MKTPDPKRPLGLLQSMSEFNSLLPKTNPTIGHSGILGPTPLYRKIQHLTQVDQVEFGEA